MGSSDSQRLPIANDGDGRSAVNDDPTTDISEEENGELAPQPDAMGLGAHDDNPLGLKDTLMPSPKKQRHWIGLFGFILMSTAMLAMLLVTTVARDKKASLLHAEEIRLQQSLEGRIVTLETWLVAQRTASRRLTDSQAFRLFVTELALHNSPQPLPRSLQDQRPYFQQLMTDFNRQNGMLRTSVVRQDGRILLSSPGPALSLSNLPYRLGRRETGWRGLLSPIRSVDTKAQVLGVDLMVPVPAMQAENSVAEAGPAVLVLTLPIDRVLREILSPLDSSALGEEAISLLQWQGDEIEQIRMGSGGPELAPFTHSDGIRPGHTVVFERRGLDDPAYSMGRPVANIGWTLLHAVDARTALWPINRFIGFATVFAAIATVAIAMVLSAFWFRKDRDHHRKIADFYKDYSQKIDQLRQFHQAITTSMSDWLVVTGRDGRLIYANSAFAAALNQSQQQIQGKAWESLPVNYMTASSTKSELAGLIVDDGFDLVEVGTDQRIVSSRISILKSRDGSIERSVRIIRDHTDLLRERRQRFLATTHTIDAFVHAVERRDPFLIGHTHRMRRYAIAVGRKLNISDNELASLALAASLSQVGKIFVPDGVLRKPARHNRSEEEIMRGHILHTIGILERIDFELPVVDIVAQMHERLDGSGYPRGLTGDDISLLARILGVVDVFCARTAPRSYRDRISPGKALYHLANHGLRYDLTVIAALAELVDSDQDMIKDDEDNTVFIDAEIWRGRHQESLHDR